MDLFIGVVNVATGLDKLIDTWMWLLHGDIFVNRPDDLPTTFFFLSVLQRPMPRDRGQDQDSSREAFCARWC